MSSVETGQMSAVETGQMSAAETGQMSAVETRQMLKSQMRGWSFLPKKSACGKLVSSNRACQIQGGHFHQKKSACGKLPSSNRACQAPAKGLAKLQSQAKSKSWLTKVPVRAKNIKFGPKWVENPLFGLKLGPNES